MEHTIVNSQLNWLFGPSTYQIWKSEIISNSFTPKFIFYLELFFVWLATLVFHFSLYSKFSLSYCSFVFWIMRWNVIWILITVKKSWHERSSYEIPVSEYQSWPMYEYIHVYLSTVGRCFIQTCLARLNESWNFPNIRRNWQRKYSQIFNLNVTCRKFFSRQLW